MVDYPNTFAQFGAHLRILRKTTALTEHTHLSDDPDFSKRLLTAVYDTTKNDEDIAVAGAKTALEVNDVGALRSLHEQQKGSFEEFFFPVLDEELDTAQEDIDAGAIEYDYDDVLLATGEVKIASKLGRFGALDRNMIADSETIKENVVTVGAVVAAPGNFGVVSATVATGLDHTFAGKAILIVESDTVGLTTFSVETKFDKELADGERIREADNDLTVGKPYEDGPTGLTLKIDLPGLANPTKAGDDGLLFSGTTITNVQAGDTDRGKIFLKVTRGTAPAEFLIEVFSDGSLSTPQGTQTISGTGGITPISITLGSGTVFASTFNNANGVTKLPVIGNEEIDITFDVLNPREGDRITLALTNDEAGNFATKTGKRYGVALNSVGGAAETISDALAASITMT